MTPDFAAEDMRWMREALAEAELAAAEGEVPVGAVLVAGGILRGRGHNQREHGRDATLHAEMIAIRNACGNMGGWRLPEATLYVTLEPCPMCAGAAMNARVDRIVFGAPDPKSGACGSVLDLPASGMLNHSAVVTGGVLAEECVALLRSFFAGRRDAGRKGRELEHD